MAGRIRMQLAPFDSGKQGLEDSPAGWPILCDCEALVSLSPIFQVLIQINLERYSR